MVKRIEDNWERFLPSFTCSVGGIDMGSNHLPILKSIDKHLQPSGPGFKSPSFRKLHNNDLLTMIIHENNKNFIVTVRYTNSSNS